MISSQNLTAKVQELLKIPVFLVGGAVRDELLKKTTKDYDFTTPALPDEIEEKIKLAGLKPILIGKKFGTIAFHLNLEERFYIEITTFRAEKYEQGSRKPNVNFHNQIEADLARRDFTINAMAIDSNQNLIDLFNGKADLENKIIRCVGDPNLRFQEDALRMLRAVRFAGQYEFVIEEKTKKSIQTNFYKLLDISKERWIMEMDKILQIPNPNYALDLLLETGLLSVVLPEIATGNLSVLLIPELKIDIWADTKKAVLNADFNNLELRWASLLMNLSRLNILSLVLVQNKFVLNSELKFYYEELLRSPYFAKYSTDSIQKNCRHLKFSNNRTDIILNSVLSTYVDQNKFMG